MYRNQDAGEKLDGELGGWVAQVEVFVVLTGSGSWRNRLLTTTIRYNSRGWVVHRLTNLQSVLRQNAMIREYRILSAASLEDLQEVVQKAIIDGWQPQGGVALALASSQYAVGKLFAHAIVRS